MLHLLREPATQKQLSSALGINSGTVSKHMKILTAANLARKTRSHSAYEVVFQPRLREVLQGIGNLKLEILDAQWATANAEQEELTRAGIRLAQPIEEAM